MAMRRPGRRGRTWRQAWFEIFPFTGQCVAPPVARLLAFGNIVLNRITPLRSTGCDRFVLRPAAGRGAVATAFATSRFGAGVGEPEVREWEIAVLHRDHRAAVGACARITWTRADPSRAFLQDHMQ